MHKMNDQLPIRTDLFFHATQLKNSIINAHLQRLCTPFPQLYKLLESLTKGFFLRRGWSGHSLGRLPLFRQWKYCLQAATVHRTAVLLKHQASSPRNDCLHMGSKIAPPFVLI